MHIAYQQSLGTWVKHTVTRSITDIARCSVCGDIPASNYIGGFKEGVAFALRKCRRCLATGDDMRAKVYYLKHTYIRIYCIW